MRRRSQPINRRSAGGSLEAQAEKIRAMAVVHGGDLIDTIVRWRGVDQEPAALRGMERLLALVDEAGPAQPKRQASLRIVGPVRALESQSLNLSIKFSAVGHLMLNIVTAVS
jgi:hypothetical protein